MESGQGAEVFSVIYLDNAATTLPKPPGVYEETLRFMRESGGNPGRGSHHYSAACSDMVETVRRKAASLFGLRDPRRLIFTYNCTDSVNMVLKCFLQTDDHVVTTNLDHNAVSRPLEELRRTKRIETSRVPFGNDGTVDPEKFRDAIRPDTKLLILTHGSNVLGSVQPLQPFLSIARERQIPLLLDCAQTAGRIRIDVHDTPLFAACSAHKNLFGMPGLGILTLPEGISLGKWREGGTGTVSESIQHPDELPMRLEAGTPNFLSIASLRYALDFLDQTGMDAVHERELQLIRPLLEFLSGDERFIQYARSESGKNRLAVAAFNLKMVPPEEAAAILDQHFGIAVRGGLHCAAVLHEQLNTLPGGCLRASPGYFNTPDDVAALINALREIASQY